MIKIRGDLDGEREKNDYSTSHSCCPSTATKKNKKELNAV